MFENGDKIYDGNLVLIILFVKLYMLHHCNVGKIYKKPIQK
jgi:hypothetical protein